MGSRSISHYCILKKLGAGGMGEVWLAEDTRLDRKVAVKLLGEEFNENEDRLRRFIGEAKAASALNHPNILTVYDVGKTEGGTHFIATEFVEGETLRNWKPDEEQRLHLALDIAMQVASALAAAHKAGIVHRDIKPENIMVRPDGLVKVLDFGLAKLTPSVGVDYEADTLIRSLHTQPGMILGTLRYMSPEQTRGRAVDLRSDIFSLGVVFYELLTGQPLFAGDTGADVIATIIHKPIPSLAERLPDVPAELERIVQKALAKDKEQRYRDARDLQVDLQNLQKHLEGGPRRDSFDARGSLAPPSLLSRRPLLLSLVVVVTLVLAAVVFFGISRWWRTPYRPPPDALYWYAKGTDAMRDGAYYTASKAFERALETDGRFALAHARLAEAYMEMDAGDRAKEEILAAISLVPQRTALPNLDALYLDALASTVRRELTAAIEDYQEIAEQSPEPEKASAYLDLGRAYERDEKIDRAIEFYQQAAKMNPQSAAALLRLAILYGRKQDSERAKEAFDRAEKTYQDSSNLEGVAEVLLQRGAMFNKINSVESARGNLEKAREIAVQTNNKSQQIRAQLQLSLVYIETDAGRARQMTVEAVNLAQTNSLRNLAVNGIIDLGYTFVSRGEYEEAGKYFKQALEFAQADKARRSEARAWLALGSLSVQQAHYDEAIPLLEQALAFYEPAGYRKEASIALTMVGRAQRGKGNYESAIRVFTEQLRLSKELGDSGLVADSHASLGLTVGLDQERYSEALPHIEESYEINHSSGSPLYAGFDEMNRAEMLWQLGYYDKARDSLKKALAIASRPEASYRGLQAWVHLIGSRMALSQRHLAEAGKEANQALELAGTQDQELAVQAKYGIGLAQALSGAPQPAIQHCQEALEIARRINNPRLVASALLALAEARLLANDAAGARDAAGQAQEAHASAGRQDSEWRALLIAARACHLAGDRQQTASFAARAASRLAALQQQWGEATFGSYLKRPDIESYRGQLTQLQADNR